MNNVVDRKLSENNLSHFLRDLEHAIFSLQVDIQELFKRNNHFPVEIFQKMSQLFYELWKTANDLNIPLFNELFYQLSEITRFCTEVENTKAHKRVAIFINDFEGTLRDLKNAIKGKKGLQPMARTFEIYRQKVERLKQREFYSLSNPKGIGAGIKKLANS